MKKIVKAILLKGNTTSKITENSSGKIGVITAFPGELPQPLHLYIVDESNPLNTGEWGIQEQSLYKNIGKGKDIRDWAKVVATTNIELIEDGIPSISQKFIQQYVQSQGEGVVYMETEEKDINQYIDNDCSFGYIIEIPKLDKAGNAILSIKQEVKPVVPTDEEIEKKAEQSATEWWTSEPDPESDTLFTKEFNSIKEKWAKQDYCCGYEDGYKQALKDLGYEYK